MQKLNNKDDSIHKKRFTTKLQMDKKTKSYRKLEAVPQHLRWGGGGGGQKNSLKQSLEKQTLKIHKRG